MKKQTVLITGASGGIGLELARLFAKDGYNLVLVARSGDALQEIAVELQNSQSISVIPISADLSETNAAEKLLKKIESKKIQIDILINNAGFGDFSPFVKADITKLHAMMMLNMVTLTELTRLIAPAMVDRGHGKILNIASTAAFLPGPLMAVYYATKAYVLSFSEAIAHELKDSGVTVTALCPGPTTSGFQQASHMNKSAIVNGKKLPTAAEVARYGYQELINGTPVAIHGWGNKMMTILIKFLPRNIIPRIVASLQKEV